MTWPELLLGFVVIAVFIFVSAWVFAAVGIEPAPRSGPLPWMVK